MTNKMMAGFRPPLPLWVAALISGSLFGAGLVLSGMAEPARVLAFLRLGPGWDASLAFVMGGALCITLPGFAWLRRRGQTFGGAPLSALVQQHIDRRLLIGAALFGAGWGLAGYCPGPALVMAGQGRLDALVIVIAMLVGAALARRA